MNRALLWKRLHGTGASIRLVLGLVLCLAISTIQAADSGPRHHAEGRYDAASGTYVVTNVDRASGQFKAPFNEIYNEARVFTPKDTTQ